MDEQKPYVINYRMCHESSCETLCTSIYKEIALLLGMNPNIILDERVQIPLNESVKIVGLSLGLNGVINGDVSITKKLLGKKGEDSFVLGTSNNDSPLSELFNKTFPPYNYITLIEAIRDTLGIKPTESMEDNEDEK